MIQKQYYEKLFLHIKGYIQFQGFFNETTEYQLPGQRISNSNEISQIMFITERRIISFFCSYVSNKSIQITPLTMFNSLF